MQLVKTTTSRVRPRVFFILVCSSVVLCVYATWREFLYRPSGHYSLIKGLMYEL